MSGDQEKMVNHPGRLASAIHVPGKAPLESQETIEVVEGGTPAPEPVAELQPQQGVRAKSPPDVR